MSCTLAALTCCAVAAIAEADRGTLLEGVTAIAAPGTPGDVIAYGKDAFSVVEVGKDGARHSVVAAGSAGRGRMLLLCHGSYAAEAVLDTADTRQFMENAIAWLVPRRSGVRRAGLIGAAGLRPLLEEAGFEVEMLSGDWISAARACNLIVCAKVNLSEQQVSTLQRAVRGGAGLLAMQTPWGWNQGSRKPLSENGLNTVVSAAGLSWTLGTGGGIGGQFATDPDPRPLLGASSARTALSLAERGDIQLTASQLRQAGTTLTRAVRNLPEGDRQLKPQLTALRALRGAIVPSRETPTLAEHAIDRFLLAWEVDRIEALDPRSVRAHPAAAIFPGVPDRGSRRTRAELQIDTTIPRWHSTGLYALAGQTLTIELPETALGDGLKVRIGAHKDQLWHKDRWNRVPRITGSWPLDQVEVTVASAFGGLVYVEVPRGCALGEVPLTIAGAIEAPYFRLGETANDRWRKTIRMRAAPWAELASDSVVLTVPSSTIRDLDDPEALMVFWEEILDAAADLRAIDRDRSSPERYVADVQISAGYMHSGYPLMTHLDAAGDMTSLERMKTGPWGLLHELGHNHQSGMWTFGGTTEVTCNLWSLYLLSTVCEVPWSAGHGGMRDRPQSLGTHLDAGAPFDRWKGSPFLALQMYAQIVESFGWEPFKMVFAEYDALPRDARPANDDQKRDQWMVRMSNAVQRNLGPFFDAWGVPVSDAAKESIASMDPWMPPDWPQ